MQLGFILYEGKSLIGDGDIICIVTLKSSNIKTGDMAQVWILPKDQNPLTALKTGENASACGRCPLQGVYSPETGRTVNRVCYVNVGQAPVAVWDAYNKGKYPKYSRKKHEFLLASRSIRIGAYGDPAALPVSLVRYLATVGTGHTGYSHQLFWIDKRRSDTLSQWLMASCHTPAQHREARRRGWRAFVAIAEGQKTPENAVECPNYTHGVSCDKCQLCQGTSKKAKDIYVITHGAVGLNLPKVQMAQGDKL